MRAYSLAPILTLTVLPAFGWCCPLTDFALQKTLQDASPIFGKFVKSEPKGGHAEWMKGHADDTLLVHMNIPGTHDSSTWNYTAATRKSLLPVTKLNNETVYPAPIYRCQEKSFHDMLNGGIRVFDLRIAFDPTKTSLVFYHSEALQSETATVDDVLFGFYQWLDYHPSETVFLSFKYESSDGQYASNNAANDNAAFQMKLFNILNSQVARKYFLQRKGSLGTLGESRGKIVLLRRFDLDKLPANYTEQLPGLHFSPDLWTDNAADITLKYNTQQDLTAYIEDYYNIELPATSGAVENIKWKLNATTKHITKATTEHPDSLFWTFASSEHNLDYNPIVPEIMALGNGTKITPEGGVNYQLIPFLKEQKGKRLGIVMFDFFDQPGELMDTFLSL